MLKVIETLSKMILYCRDYTITVQSQIQAKRRKLKATSVLNLGLNEVF